MRAFFGFLLILIGGLWVALTGACTLFYGFMGAQGVFARDPESHAYGWMFLVPAIVIGAISIAPGAGILIIGLLLARKPKDPPPPDQAAPPP